MNNDAVLATQGILSIWQLFTGFKIPGIGFTPAQLIFGILSFRVLIWAMINVFGLGESFDSNLFSEKGSKKK